MMTNIKILVVGYPPYDTGKTTLCKALIYGLKEKGLNVIPFKPHSGISYWNQFDTFQVNLKKNSLVCADIICLEEAATSQLPLEILNPVNRLSAPITDFDGKLSEEKRVFQEFLAERFTHNDVPKPKDSYFFNRTVKNGHLRDIKKFYGKIKKKADKVLLIKKFQDLVQAYIDNFSKATSSCYNYIKNESLIVESYNDAAFPFGEAGDCDLIFCCSSNTILQFDKKKYFNTIKSFTGGKSTLQLTVSDIYVPSLVVKTFPIQPLTAEEVNDPTKLVNNYSKILKTLIK